MHVGFINVSCDLPIGSLYRHGKEVNQGGTNSPGQASPENALAILHNMWQKKNMLRRVSASTSVKLIDPFGRTVASVQLIIRG